MIVIKVDEQGAFFKAEDTAETGGKGGFASFVLMVSF